MALILMQLLESVNTVLKTTIILLIKIYAKHVHLASSLILLLKNVFHVQVELIITRLLKFAQSRK